MVLAPGRPRLAQRGHRAIAVELPADDDTKGLSDYAQAVVDAAGSTRDVVVVAASLGARARLRVEPVVVSGGHLAALSRPEEVTAAILAATGG